MARTPASAAASRIRIEDEVWEEAFSSRLPARRRSTTEAPRPVLASTSARPPRSRPAAVRPAATPPRSGAAPALRIAEAPADRRQSAVPEEGRRTIRIQGRGADPYRSDPSLRARSGFESSPLPRSMANSPDRLAMWATLLGFLLVVVAILSSHL